MRERKNKNSIIENYEDLIENCCNKGYNSKKWSIMEKSLWNQINNEDVTMEDYCNMTKKKIFNRSTQN